MTSSRSTSVISEGPQHAGRDINIITRDSDPFTYLLQHCALGALHDAAERPDPPKCHPETRTAILDRIELWARDESADAKPILWLTGPAGAGKSAISQTVIERWLSHGLVVPNFFLWRTAMNRNQITPIIPTIAFQLTNLLPETRPIIEAAVKDTGIFEQRLRAQVEALIINPLRLAEPKCHPVIIVLDGLDECCLDLPSRANFPGQSYQEQQQEILEGIGFACQRVPSIRILVASRPERQIRKMFARNPLLNLSVSLLLSNESNAAADITLYLDCKFAEIRSEHPGIDPSWPSREQIHELVNKSAGSFIYPSMVVQYVSGLHHHPVTRLQEVLALQPWLNGQKGHPLAELDALYTLVLKTVDMDSIPIVMILLGLMSYHPVESIPFARYHPLNIFQSVRMAYTTVCLEKFFLLLDGELPRHLLDIHSILSISQSAEDPIAKIGFVHATFSEFLRDKSRSREFFVSKSETNLQISLLLLRHGTIAQPPNHGVYSLVPLYRALAYYTEESPLSADLMKGLWRLLKDEIGEYSLISQPNSHPDVLETNKKKHIHYFQGPVSGYLGKHEQCWLLQYLQRCNISTIEPSKGQREAVTAHLANLWSLIDSDSAFRLLNGVGDSEEQGGEDHSEDAEDQGARRIKQEIRWASANRMVVAKKKSLLRRCWSQLGHLALFLC